MSNYLIKLIPTGRFFFGGDMTLSVGLKESNKKSHELTDDEKRQIAFNKRYSSYIIGSQKFPQQTSLLGMLRFLLLRSNPNLFKNNKIIEGKKSEVEKLIGKTSFPNKNYDYGLIKKLSPCFLMKGDDIVPRLPMDYNLSEINLTANSSSAFYNGQEVCLSEIKNSENEQYKGKDGIMTKYGNNKENEIFIEDRRIGINRDINTGHTQDNSLFKRVSYRLADDFCFALYAQIDGRDISSSNQMVSLGASSSQFKIEIKRINDEEDFPPICLPQSKAKVIGNYGRVVLTSPAYINKETMKAVCFAITETLPFRYMQTTTDVKDYNRLSGEIKHSGKVELFQTGSVFYFKEEKDAQDFAAKLRGHKDFYQIGYNHYQISNELKK